MSIVFLNGDFVEENEAKVSINDAGYYFGDGVYEVILVYNRQLKEAELHLDRLISSFQKVYLKNYPSKEKILKQIDELLKKNQEVNIGSIYIQFTRGVTPRSHSFADLDLKPTWFMKIAPYEVNFDLHKTYHCNVLEDPRRMRCDIKTISLLPMVLSKYETENSGFDDVIYYNSRVNSITEGSSFNVFIVDENNHLITYPVSNEILAGCTRARTIQVAKENGFNVEERKISKEELLNAKEVFITAALKPIIPVLKVSGSKIGDGKIGTTTKIINEKLVNFLVNN